MTTTRVARVVTEVAALERPFDYAITEKTSQVSVGDRVRVPLHGRSIRGWVWEITDTDRDVLNLTKWLGRGIPPSLKPILTWASARWAGSLVRFLTAASPDHVVTELPERPAFVPLEDSIATTALDVAAGVVQLAPCRDPLALVLYAYHSVAEVEGSLLILVPTEAWARRLGGRLAQRGVPVAFATQWERARAGWPVVIGSRGTAFAPVPLVRGAVVLDADDEAYRSEAAPTWHAVDVVRERCRRAGAPYWFTSPFPSPSLRFHEAAFTSAPDEVANWPAIDIVDRRLADPRDGALSQAALSYAHAALAGEEPVAVAVLLQRLGAGRLLACTVCGELARCALCENVESERDEQLVCDRDGTSRPLFCRHCGSTKLRRLQSGVSTLARDVAAQLGQPVTEVTASTPLEAATTRVVVGTEALWQRVRRAQLVIFADFDQYLLAPRERARRDAVLAVAKAGRVVGARSDARGRVILQTRRGEDTVVRALAHIDFRELAQRDDDAAQELALPPYGALARLTGDAAGDYATALSAPDVLVHDSIDGFIVSAATIEILTSRLASTPRPPGRLRVAVT